MKKTALIAILSCMLLTLCAQTRKISGTYIYYADPSMSVKEAKAAAIENARVQALAKEFGTLIVQSTLSQEQQKQGRENSYFMQLNTSEVKGEWIEDTKEPEAVITATLPDDVMVIEATVHGKARPISNEAAEFETMVLRNGTEQRFAATNFKNGDDLYLYFKSPANGYVAVYLIDESQTAYCLLPYANDPNGQQPVEHGKEYVFFSPEYVYDVPRNIIDQVYMTCDDENVEHNQLYVIYSPNIFTKAVDDDKQTNDGRLLPRQLSVKDFSRWLGKLSSHDKQMNRKIFRLAVRK